MEYLTGGSLFATILRLAGTSDVSG